MQGTKDSARHIVSAQLTGAIITVSPSQLCFIHQNGTMVSSSYRCMPFQMGKALLFQN